MKNLGLLENENPTARRAESTQAWRMKVGVVEEKRWRGRRELFAWCSAEPRRWGRDCAEEVGGGLVARMNTEYGEEIWRVCWIVPKFEEEIVVK